MPSENNGAIHDHPRIMSTATKLRRTRMTNVLNSPHSITKPERRRGPSAEELLRLRRRFLNPGLFLWYKRPLLIVEGKAQYLFDEHATSGQVPAFIAESIQGIGGCVVVSGNLPEARVRTCACRRRSVHRR